MIRMNLLSMCTRTIHLFSPIKRLDNAITGIIPKSIQSNTTITIIIVIMILNIIIVDITTTKKNHGHYNQSKQYLVDRSSVSSSCLSIPIVLFIIRASILNIKLSSNSSVKWQWHSKWQWKSKPKWLSKRKDSE